ncbi:hypothetical protein DEJ50_10320 [Streptomyces venezuelae]|uniref:DUF4097 domain-containing protein n=1 Tax=Streptomyces venezuelae TaxID=54571 RepID=A0A5P2D288_STRVZ|nr:DUF4097 family beta strand repeat-containing protein [Streptomyces venezuelae]QES48148.1 hypothetical protein DEJ50_10320 [Streptomyces venezuelae]
MPAFETTEAISAIVEIEVGSIRITASKRTDTLVEVLPGNPGHDGDVRAAEATKVSCSGNTLTVKGPKKSGLFGRTPTVEVSIELPTGSEVRAGTVVGDIDLVGAFADCRLKTAMGELRIDRATTVHLKNDHGGVHVEEITGDADITVSGRAEIGRIDGRAVLGNANGETILGTVAGDLRAKVSNGSITVGAAHAGVDARSSNGPIRIGEVVRGRVVLETAVGEVEVGIRRATAAWLDVHTDLGSVQNHLGCVDGPTATDETVEVRARSGYGDIVIHRA